MNSDSVHDNYVNGKLSIVLNNKKEVMMTYSRSLSKLPFSIGCSPSRLQPFFGLMKSLTLFGRALDLNETLKYSRSENTLFDDSSILARVFNSDKTLFTVILPDTDEDEPIPEFSQESDIKLKSKHGSGSLKKSSSSSKQNSDSSKQKEESYKPKQTTTKTEFTKSFKSHTHYAYNLLYKYHSRPHRFTISPNLHTTTNYPQPSPISTSKCTNDAPSKIPAPEGSLKTFIDTLIQDSDAYNIRYGRFSVTVPKELTLDYHFLNEFRAQHVRNATCFAWSNYRDKAWGHDEIQPKSGKSSDRWGRIGMTILDAIDTLKLLSLDEELPAIKEFVSKLSFDVDSDQPVFEIIIRALGGLLSAYELTKDPIYLRKANMLGKKLLPAFDTPSGYPKSIVRLASGEFTTRLDTKGKCILSEVGTVSLELLSLHKHTTNKRYKAAVSKLYDSLEKSKKWDGLLSTYMDSDTGSMAGGTFSFGAGGDSYYEYLLKTWIIRGKNDTRLQRMYNEAIEGMTNHLLKRTKSGLLFISHTEGKELKNSMGHLECFVGGMLALGVMHNVNMATKERDLRNAKGLAYTCFRMYKSTVTGVGAENVIIEDDKMHTSFNPEYILRPEAIETMYYLNQITGDPIYREWGWIMWRSIEKYCKTKYGYTELRNVNNVMSQGDSTESFFFAETLKYAYLLFKDDKVVNLVKTVFNTEGHPLNVF